MATDFRSLLEAWGTSDDLTGELVDIRFQGARQPVFADPSAPIHPSVGESLKKAGIDLLFRHQAVALDHIRAGRHVVVVAGTAGGKSLCYQIPIGEATAVDAKSTALCIYPTKALAQDQVRAFNRLDLPGVAISTYDGDTALDQRASIRRSSNVIATNPDMLHIGILPHHGSWADFIHRLRYVVVDEMHTLRGIFGTHVAMVLRRLRRLCRHYGSDPIFVFGSATIGNPGRLATDLTGLEVEVIDDDASGSGERWSVLWNPELTDVDEGERRSALAQSTDLLVDLVDRDVSTIVFARSRKSTELIYRWARERLGSARQGRLAVYRGGYLPEQRRRIEAELFGGNLLGVVTTNALELGIDVGSLEAAILTTFPGTISSFRQQAGRAGRTLDGSLVVLVGGEDALDQYFMSHPDELYVREPEAVVVNPTNPSVAEAHAGCAAFELPLRLEDRDILGEAMEEAANRLVQEEWLKMREEALYWASRRRPAPSIDLRASSGSRFDILDTAAGEILGVADEDRAYRDGHEGAVYLHQGETYVVSELDIEHHEIRVTRAKTSYFTQPRVETDLEVIERVASTSLGSASLHLGRVRVHSQVTAYQKRTLHSRQLIDQLPLDLPAVTYETTAFWLTIPDQMLRLASVDPAAIPGTLHAAEHAAIALMPLRAVCDRWDIGGLSTPWHPVSGGPAIFIYEAYAGGTGISEIAFGAGADHWAATRDAIAACPCAGGCPSCVQSPKCGNFNEPLDKSGALRFLDRLTAATV